MKVPIHRSRALGALVFLASLAAARAADAKNYLVLIADDTSVDKVGAYASDFPGYTPTYRPNTQAIDSLAASGLRFTRAWATPMCSPTRASFQTGQYPFRTGIGDALGTNAAGLDTSAFTMLAQSFADRGYTTGLFGKYHIGTRDANGVVGFPAGALFTVAPHPALAGWDRFFGNYDGYLGTDPGDPNDGYFKWKRVGWLKGGTGHTGTETTHATDRTVEVALSWINSRTEQWLAVVAFNAGHSGTTASSAWGYADVDPTQYRSASLACLATQTCADVKRQSYQGLVEHMDLQIQALLDGMDPDVRDDTLILFFGDNGTPVAVEEDDFNVAGRGKGSTYENGVRVPLIIADGATWGGGGPGPTIPVTGRTISARVNTLDLFNTLHDDAFGITITAATDSSSFADCFTVNDPHCGFLSRRYAYTETFPSNASPSGAKMAVAYGDDKMVGVYDSANACLRVTYYDVSADPFETAPQTWTGTRAARLRSYFTNLHTFVTSWANPTGAALIAFCP